ncbi:putative reverse transcriptase domain-containing protein [Tanacetum coccineum]
MWTSILLNPSPKKVVERETEETTDKEQTNFQGSTAHVRPPVNPIPILEPDVPKTLPKPNIPYQKHANESIKMINFIDISCEDSFGEVLRLKKSNHFSSGSTTPLSNSRPSLTSFETSDSLLEKFADELALLDPFPPGNEDFDFEADLREFELLLNHDPSTDFSPTITNDLNPERFSDKPALACLPPPRDDESFLNKDVQEPVSLNTPLFDEDECFDTGGKINKIDAFMDDYNDLEGEAFRCSLIPLSRGSFDVIVGMDWLSKRKFVIVCHEKVVRIPLEGDEILQVHGERTQGVVKTLMNTKFHIDLVHGATSVAKSPYRLAPLEMQELSEQLRELQDKVLELLRKEKLYAKFTKSEAVKNLGSTYDTIRDMIILRIGRRRTKRGFPDVSLNYIKSNKNVIVGDALSRNERVKSRRVRGMILAAQSEAFKQENVLAERLHGLDQKMERKGDESLYFMDRILVLLVGSVMDETHASRYLVHPGADKTYYNLDNSKEWNSGDDQLRLRWMIYLVVLADTAESVKDTIGYEYGLSSPNGWLNWDVHLPLAEFSYNNSYHSSIRCALFEALYGRKSRSPILWAKIGESSLIGLELVQETTHKVVLIKEKLKVARDRQKSYSDNRRKPLEFEVGDRVMLKVSPWKGVIRFGKKGKLAPRYVEPFEILERVGTVAYRLRLPEELSGVHDTFHVSNLKKCLADASLHVP